MRIVRGLRLRFFIIITVLVFVMGCGGYEEAEPTNDNNKQQVKAKNFIKGKFNRPTPKKIEVYSKSDPVIVTIDDTLNLDKLGISPGDLLTYHIHLYVHPLDIGYWYRQNPASAQERWTAQANLSLYWENEAGGYLSRRTVRNGWGFEIIAVLIKQSLSKTLPEIVFNLEDLIKLKGVHVVSEIRTAIVKR